MNDTAHGPIDPRQLIEDRPMGGRQWLIVALCIALNALDGFDVLSISFAAPGISTEWGVDRAALGVVLSMELFGMAFGSVVLGPLADRLGRRPVTLVCLVVMALGMAGAAVASSVLELTIIRLITGLGIGGLLACVNAVVSEASNAKLKGRAIALMTAGYPGGAVLGGIIASEILVGGSWRDIFVFGASVTAVLIPLVWWLMPESIDGLMRRKDESGKLARINRALNRMGHASIDAVAGNPSERPARPAELFAGRMKAITIMLILAYFLHMMTFYFLLKWVPKIVVDMGFSPSSAGTVLVWTSGGGAIGTLVFSALSGKVPLRVLAVGTMLGSFAFLALFGFAASTLFTITLFAALFGFFANAAVVGLYASIAAAYPAYLRAGGTGFVIGFGRGGAALGPVVAGLVFAAGLSLGAASLLMAVGSLLGGLLMWRLRYD